MFDDGNNIKSIVADLKIKSIAAVYARLPDVARLIIFLGAQRRMKEIAY